MRRARRRWRVAPSARADHRQDHHTAGRRHTFRLPPQECKPDHQAAAIKGSGSIPRREIHVRKQITRPRMSCPGEPGEKKTGKQTRATLRPHSKISNQYVRISYPAVSFCSLVGSLARSLSNSARPCS
eukprot:2385086-Prymnesium_polylepis.1